MSHDFKNTLSSVSNASELRAPLLFKLRGEVAAAANDNALPLHPTPAANDNVGPHVVCDEISAANILAEIFRIAQGSPRNSLV